MCYSPLSDKSVLHNEREESMGGVGVFKVGLFGYFIRYSLGVGVG